MSKTDVLNAKSQKPVVDTEEYKRLVGGRLSNIGVGRVLKRFRRKASSPMAEVPMSSGGAIVGSGRGKKIGKFLK